MENRLYTDQSLMRADRATRLMTGLDGLLGATSTLHQYREDGYVNVLNQYGTKNDTTEQYDFAPESAVMDQKLSQMYEGDGLFAKIIDTPSNECVKHGIKFDNLSDSETQNFLFKALDDLDWEESFATAVKWSRLFGGAIIVMLIDDGGSLDQPVNWKAVKSIDELRVYERAIVQPDWNSLYRYNPEYGGRSRSGGRFGMPEYFTVMSMYGSFIVHESRCLMFRNGRLPERCTNPLYRIWGMPEYIRIRRAMRDVSIAHGDATKLLERSVQAVYSMKGLADEVTTEEGENRILKRLQTIDTSRGLMNTISIDADGESYDFKTFSFSGISSVVDVSCNLLSAITNIPQTLLFGRSPAGMSATGESDMENYYNFVERIQKTSVKPNLMRLLDVVIQAGIAAGELQEAPDFQLEFNPLWSLSDAELAQVEATKAATEKTKADTAALYCNLQVLDPQEIRRGLASSESFSVEEVLTDDAVTDEEFLAALTQPADESENPQEQPDESTPLLPAQKQPQQAPERDVDAPVSTNNADEKRRQNRDDDGDDDADWITVNYKKVNSDGGPGSGNFGHEGRPGKVGGAAKGEGGSNKSAARESGASKLKSMSDNDFQKSTGYSKKNPDSAKVAYALADKGFSPKEIKETKKLFDRHSLGNEPQKNADNEISAHIKDEDVIGRLMLDKSVIEEKALRDSGTTEFYRKGALDKDVLAFTDDPEGATMPTGENGELEHIGWDVNVSLDDLLAKGYRPIAGGNCADVGSPSEKEILFAKFPDASSYEDLDSIRSKESEAAKEYSKSYKSLIPENSYFNDPSYENDFKKFTDCNKVIDDTMKIVKDLENRIATEGVIKPRSEWTEEDEVDAMFGNPPMKYPENVEGYKMAKDSILTSLDNVEKDRDAANERMQKAKQKAHDEQIKSVSFDKPVKASSDNYEGFTTKTTGTGYDEYLNGKQSGGYIAEMSPAEYLKRCAYQVFENATIESTLAAINEKNVDEYAKKMESGEKFDMPYLNLKKGEQEGRHRAAAAMKAGIEKIPVLVVGYKQNTDSADKRGSVGVIVVKDGKILCGVRCGNTAKGTICGPGGHIENGETPEQAAIRETHEEFGITPKELIPLGFGDYESATGYEPYLFLCLNYDGTPSCDDGEMLAPAFIAPDELFSIYGESLFQPFESGIKILFDCLNETRGDEAYFARELDFVKNKRDSEELFPNNETDCLTSEVQHDRIESYQQNIDGGKGSGNFGHKGVPGQVGGSAPEGTGISITKFRTSGRVMDITSDLEVKASKSGKTTVTIKGGEKIDKIYTFAGKGSNKELRVANDLARQTNTDPKDWSHKSGFGNVVTAKGKVERAEIHWFENDKVGQIKFKVKKRG